MSRSDTGGRFCARLQSFPGPSRPKTPQHPAFTEPMPRDFAERRQVTVMFSDLVDSTAMSVRMDPEDLREIISAYQKCVGETVRRFGGFVAKYMGDGVLAYFGYPQSREDRCRARSASGAGSGRGGQRAPNLRSSPNPRNRNCDRAGIGRRLGGARARFCLSRGPCTRLWDWCRAGRNCSAGPRHS